MRTETLAEGAARHGVTPKTVRRWIAAGRLTAYRFGPRLLRIDPDELDALLQPIPTAKTRRSA